MRSPVPRLKFVLSLLVGTAALGSALWAADMSAREISQKLFKIANGETADFTGKDFSGLDLAGLDFKGANLAGANLYGADLSEASLARTDLTGAKLDRATITRTDFAEAILVETTILRPSIYAGLAPHVGEAPRFSDARMTGARIFGRLDFADFQRADMTGVKFVGTDGRDENLSLGRGSFRAANFSGAILKDSNFGGANFSYSHFKGTDLRGANMRGSDLTRADFREADLTGADVTGANLDEADLSGAKGLDQLKGLSEALNVGRAVR
jgi:uncharacterized protein YjbI with pentapeptide repeats